MQEKQSKSYYVIPRQNFADLRDKIAKLNKRAAKLAVPEITFEEVGGETAETETGGYQQNLFIRVEGQHPHFDGWTFVASLDHVFGTEAGTEAIVRTSPHYEGNVPSEYRNRGNVCDHCKQNRNRKSTYIVLHETEGYKQIGSTCIQDFLGGQTPENLASWAELIFSIDELISESESCGGTGGGFVGYTLSELLPQVAAFIRVDGWTSRTVARETGRVATADCATRWIDSMDWREKTRLSDPETYEALRPTNEDTKLVADALTWVTENWETLEDRNDYQHNVCLIVRNGFAPYRSVGVAGSIIAVYMREQAKQTESKLPEITNQCFGDVGQRVVCEAYVSGLSGFEGYYGWTTVVSLVVTFEGKAHRATWFASGETQVTELTDEGLDTREVQRGDKIWVRGTIKDHGSYKGRAQTQFSRCCLFNYDPNDKANKKKIRQIKKAAKAA